MKILNKFKWFLSLGVFLVTFSCIDENFDGETTEGLSGREILINILNEENRQIGEDADGNPIGELDLFIEFVEEAGFIGDLAGTRTQDQLTIFVPTNNAFAISIATLGYNNLDQLLADRDEDGNLLFDFESIIGTHIARTSLTAQQIQEKDFDAIATFGANIPVNRTDDGFILNRDEDLSVVRSNDTGNGVVHVINRAMFPPTFSALFEEFFDDCENVVGNTWLRIVAEQENPSSEPWNCSNFGFEGAGVRANGFASGATVLDAFLVSPQFSFSDANEIRFQYESRFSGPAPELYIIEEFDGDEINLDDWTRVNVSFPAPAGGNGVWNPVAVEIPAAFQGGNFRVAFRYRSNSDGARRVTIDDFQVGVQ
ncbi:MAG: fasciclin domain-containing protein [Cyclobacteriaceae bacterium]|nr:fasciclin domain-containing protein [Cyclobacteriaceae bacterium]MCH8515579.1 fasciclin domain-containing protein [Cyclobacteriaceae bacterium]